MKFDWRNDLSGRFVTRRQRRDCAGVSLAQWVPVCLWRVSSRSCLRQQPQWRCPFWNAWWSKPPAALALNKRKAVNPGHHAPVLSDRRGSVKLYRPMRLLSVHRIVSSIRAFYRSFTMRKCRCAAETDRAILFPSKKHWPVWPYRFENNLMLREARRGKTYRN